ncbi:unnamed protein product [Closterium sp. NIES-53]
MAALRIEEDEAVEEGVQKFFDLLTRLEGADLNYSELQKKTKLLALLPESWSSLIINLNRDLPRLSLEDVKRAILQEDFRRRELASADGTGAASIGQGQEGRGAGGGRGRGHGGRGGRGGGAASMKSAGNESESRDDRFPGQFFFVSTQASAGPEKDDGFEEPAAVGKVTLHSLDYWVIDSGATYSMTPRADLLELEPSPVKHVTSALGQRAEVKGMGKAMFKGADGKMVGLKNDRDVYNEMWQIPVVPMPKERQVAASIGTKGEAVGSGDGANGRAKEIKSKKCNLGGTSKLGEHEESGAAAKKQHKGEENPMAAAEEEYGENMWGTIAMKNEMVAGIRVKGEPDEALGCPTCMQAKFTRYPFSSSEATAKAPLDEVVMDVVGPPKLGAAGAEYFLTIVDVYTRMTWVYVLSKKSDVAETVMTDWLPMVERQQDRLVKAIRTDRGEEFLSKEFGLWLKKNGIRHSLTMPYSLAMNGIAERANRTITETARGLLVEAGLPDYFWPDAVRSACVAKNRALTHVGADKWVPYVEWIGRKPKVDMLRVFRCMCMALVPKHLRHNKLGAKAIWVVHLGMAQNNKGWLLWDPFTKKFLVSRDCKFMENLMYKDWKAENEAKIGVRFEDVKSSGLEHVELPLELSSSNTTTRQSSLVNGREEAKDAEEEEEEVQQVSERAPTLPFRTTSAPRIRVTPQQRQGLHVPAAEEEGRGKRRIQAPNRLTYDALGKLAKSALAGAALIIGDDEESDYDECAFVFFCPEWKKAMEIELKSIEENGTWELVELPEGRKAITSKWLFKIKSDADGKIGRYKSRLVAKGYQQKEKVEYKELFAPVVKPTTLRTLLAGAAIKGWVVKQMDVTTAFLNGVLEEEIFMAQAEGFDDGSGRVLKLKRALYGLKQAPRQWYLKLRGVLEEIGFTPSTADHSLFMLGEGEQRSFMVVYVDDILIFSPSSDLVKEVMLKLQDKFMCKALVCEGERRRFHSLVGSLMYAALNTRPDIAFATGQLDRVVQCPNEEQVAAGMRVAKYLGQTPTVGLQYSAAAQRRQKGADGVEPGRLFLTAFSDASFASEPEDMTSVGGFICCVGGGPTAWESKKQVDQALSSVEPEYMALFRVVREIVWQRRLLAELGEEQQGPTPLYCDSQGAIALAKNPVLHGLTKHMRGSLHEEIWLCRPPGFTGSFPPGTQWSLRRPVYGLRQAPREWHDTLRTTLAALGFAPSTADPSLFLRTDTLLPLFYILVYVDDLVFATADTEALALITRDRARRTITLTQSHMVQQVLQRFGFTWSSAQATPLATGHSLSAPPSDESVEPSGPYPELVGCLMCLMTYTRPDLAYPLGLLARYVAPGRHRKVQMDAAKRVLRYLCSTSGMGLVLGGQGDVVLTGHSDASWVDDQATQRSSQGYTFSLGSGSDSWRSTRSSSVLGSNCEAEIYATAMAAQELRWLTYLLTDLGEAPRSPPVLYVDNKAAIALCQEHRLEHRTKHIALLYFLARELQLRGQLRLTYVATRANTADIFIKALPPGDHQRFCIFLGLVPTLPHLL